MSFIAVAIGAVAVGSAVYSADAGRKAANKQTDALKLQQQNDATAAVEAQTTAAVNAGSLAAGQKRAYQANVLGLGGTRDASLGAGGTPTTTPKTSVLGGGAL